MDNDKLDFEGFLNPRVVQCFAEYMHKHRKQSDGTLRASDNWQKGMPLDVLMKSGWRHFFDWWSEHRGYNSREGVKDALCGLLFNANAYLLAVLLEEDKEIEQFEADMNKLRNEYQTVQNVQAISASNQQDQKPEPQPSILEKFFRGR